MRILFRGRVHSLAGDSNSLLVEGGIITWVGKGRPPRRPQEVVVTGPGELIAPGFIDLQVNGFGGHDAATGTDAIAAISQLLPATGVTAFLPTLISAPVEIGVGFTAAAGAAAARAKGARVLGSHLEGPFINRAFRGAHELKCLADPTSEQVDVIAQARPRLVTIAPELPGGLDAIARLRAARVVVSAGHTGADFECGRAAIAAGVRFGTHIYNAMTPVHHRRPGIALALLLDPKVTVGLISDGEHVHPAVWEQVVRAKGASHVALTTDQTAAAGMPVGSYMLSGQRVVSDGDAVRLEDGTLAGSVATMDHLVRRMSELPGMSVARAIGMASTVPARVLGERSLGRIRVGACADLVVLDRDRRVRLTMVGGEVKFRRRGARREPAPAASAGRAT
ncbi:MAG: N-acetylglucosamine-6-phosphate deacetylase [Candidatus Dormibacteraeota bacterium]|nr:N-acetylglucosamine-6-phosphate deacetylase [Candidatus Dormibacteraeota bacterium]